MAAPTFVDSTFLVARYDRADKFHARARAYLKNLSASRGERIRLILNDYIFDEVITTLLHRTRRHDLTRTAGEMLRSSRTAEILPVQRAMLEKAWTLFSGRPDKLWSFTDCVSFVMMEDLGLTTALTFDGNFEEAGFLALP